MATADTFRSRIAERCRGRLFAGEVLECTVYDRRGRPLGPMAELVVNARSGRVEFGVVALESDADGAGRFLPLPWHALDFGERGGIRAPLTQAQVEQAPRCREEEIVDLARRDVAVDVHAYYGLQPERSERVGRAATGGMG